MRLHVDIEEERLVAEPSIEPVQMISVLCEARVDICVIDLEASKSQRGLRESTLSLGRKLPGRLSYGGGVRSISDGERTLDAGFKHFIVGSRILEQHGSVGKMVEKFSGHFHPKNWSIAIDHDGEKLVGRAFIDKSKQDMWLYTKEIDKNIHVDVGICITSASSAQDLTGINIRVAEEVKRRYPYREVFYGGGIRTLGDLRKVRAQGLKPIIGRGLFSCPLFARAILGVEVADMICGVGRK